MALREYIDRPNIGRLGRSLPAQKRIIPMPIKSPQSEDGKRVSKETYWAEYYEHPDFTYEWNNGILEVKPVAKIIQSDMYRWFQLLLNVYLRVHPIAKMVMLEIGFELPLQSGDRVRIPDLGVIRHDNPVLARPEDHKYKGVFDLCIESLSDSNIRQIERDVKTKKFEYAEIGVKEYYILDDRRNRHMNFYRLTSLGFYTPIRPTKEGIIRSSVLPGFQFDIEDLYLQPELDELVDSPVYRDFIWPEYLAEKERADDAEEQIEVLQKQTKSEQERADLAEEQAKAEQERVKAEQERADLAEEQAKAEQERVKAEQERADFAERQAKVEQERVKAEQERADLAERQAKAEQERVKAEQERADLAERQAKAEQERVKAEQERADLAEEQAKAEQERVKAEQERADLAEEQAKAEQERVKAEQERADFAERQAKAEQERAEAAIQKAEEYAAKLRELGIEIE